MFKSVPRALRINVRPGMNVPAGKIGFKAAYPCVVKLLVTERGLRPLYNFSGPHYSDKFRVREVLTLGIYNKRTRKFVKSARTTTRAGAKYVVGQLTQPDSFTIDRSDDCGHGIHMFPDYKKAAALL